ncbi:MAG: carboxypeptidase-like regulatory domain-containing protein [Flavobacteriaceae bacterium]|nr:carboxypeptidase-like regulatory domain-containing protein [Flavobacteriaceae bacterium]
MKTRHTAVNHISTFVVSLLFLLGFFSSEIFAQTPENESYKQYGGKVIDSKTKEPLIFATLLIEGTNVSTITNTDGEFLLKVPTSLQDSKVSISFIGYQPINIPLAQFKEEKNEIELVVSVLQLSEINVKLPKDAKSLVRTVLKKKGETGLNSDIVMTAFYRETIKKRKKNASLAEAIVTVYKEPNFSSKKDAISLYKARKSTDYSRLDTIALKLQGGPYNPLYADMIKYPEYIFADDEVDQYTFNFLPSTTVDDRLVYVVNFKQLPSISEPLYYGKLYIDAESLALTSAIYNLNVEDKNLASNLFVKKKPSNISVYPTNAAYRVDYRQKDGKWYYGYSNVQLAFKIVRKGKWFNSVYSLSSEMAVTDWKVNASGETLKNREKLRPSIIISDEASGFSDPDFWGAYNVIEPEKSIEAAINKIRRQLKRVDSEL